MGLTARCVAADKVTTDAVHHVWYLSTVPIYFLFSLRPCSDFFSDRGNWSDGRAEESRRGYWCLESLFFPSKHLEWDLPFPMPEPPNLDRTEHNSPVTWDQHTPAQSGFVSCVLET